MPPSNKKKSRPASDKKSAARNSSGRATGKGPKVSKEGGAKKFSAKRPTKSATDKPSRATRKRETAGIPDKTFTSKRGGTGVKKDRTRFSKPTGEGKTFSSTRSPKTFGDRPSKPYKDREGESDRPSSNRSSESKRGTGFKKENSRFDKPTGEGKTFSKTRSSKTFEDRPSKPYKDRDGDSDGQSSEKSYESKRGTGFKKENSRFDKPAGEGKTFSSKRPSAAGSDKPSRPRKSDDFDEKGNSFETKKNSFDKDNTREEKTFGEAKSTKRVPKSFDDRGSKPRKTFTKDAGAESSFDKPAGEATSSSKRKTGKPTESIDGQIRLNRYISNSGLCSRRDADELIAQGLISVNGKVEVELGLKVHPHDVVKYEGRTLKPERMAYVLLNKPKDFITTMDDPEDRKTVMDLVKNACKERVYPVGRLDRNTTGLLLLTNDGELAEKLTHPSHQIGKIYQVDLDRPITEADMDKIVAGVHLEDGVVNVKDIAIVSADKKILGVEITEGRNRVVRRLFEALGYDVVRLDRVSYAGLTKKDLPRGTWRLVTEKEIARLKHSIKN